MKILNAVLAAATLSIAVPVMAGAGRMNMNHEGKTHGAVMAHDAATPKAKMSEGTIKNVDKAAGKITIAHGPLENLGMPGMTMAFAVKDKAMLNQVKASDKVHFVVESVNGALTVTTLERTK